MSADNYYDVLEQLHSIGLIVNAPIVGKLTRCDVDAVRKRKTGWYDLRSFFLQNGQEVLVGWYGVNRGADHGSRQIQLDKKKWQLSDDEKRAFAERQAEIKKSQDKLRKKEIADAAFLADIVFFRCLHVKR